MSTTPEGNDRDTNTIHYADTAHEVFPDGHNWWTQRDTNEMTVNNLRLYVGPIDGGYETLQYSFVTECPARPGNFMAHGYVLFGDYTVFVQHTSAHPITRELIDSVAHTVMGRIVKTSSTNHLRMAHGKAKYWP